MDNFDNVEGFSGYDFKLLKKKTSERKKKVRKLKIALPKDFITEFREWLHHKKVADKFTLTSSSQNVGAAIRLTRHISPEGIGILMLSLPLGGGYDGVSDLQILDQIIAVRERLAVREDADRYFSLLNNLPRSN